mmetsp:Transcript_68789/g.212761  ORF Transcript_68789/g.212761 Transcript_68789/m.212761 type:complete len:207 (+) Transcript_68789:265-885(+)
MRSAGRGLGRALLGQRCGSESERHRGGMATPQAATAPHDPPVRGAVWGVLPRDGTRSVWPSQGSAGLAASRLLSHAGFCRKRVLPGHDDVCAGHAGGELPGRAASGRAPHRDAGPRGSVGFAGNRRCGGTLGSHAARRPHHPRSCVLPRGYGLRARRGRSRDWAARCPGRGPRSRCERRVARRARVPRLARSVSLDAADILLHEHF